MFRYYGRIQNKAEALKAVYFTSEGAGTVKIIVLRGTQPQSAVLVSEYASTDWTRLYQTNIETTLDEDDPTVCRFRVQFAPLNRGFNPNIKLTIYAYLPLELKNVSIQGSYIDLMYLGPNVADTLNVEVQQGSVRILTPILAKRITLSTTKGNLKMDNVHATTIHIKSLDQDSVGTISGTIGGFNSAILETRSGDIRAILNPIANASIFMRSISGSYYLTTYGFKGNLTFSSQVHPGLFDGIDFPLLGLFPTRATVGGKDGKGIMYVETQTGLGQLFFKE
ncbi:hypothetical protein BCR33DRAFT_741309 [Rhizoclosmatium globosum]|uniref:Adhesin domain-containing protein n=1 Tax=Rhizoclosmatium globosum TaxID=329046 RepID=A0A1Y2BVN3_9FUNG|nr:hypothetical protein BCR33DRAFT_741309 [Rhizoclosmatium globosum]|eukprot:ORY38806.1 hypothetical protein BCR33DRAFT_741309 [Rhizoclosmatium globosum]